MHPSKRDKSNNPRGPQALRRNGKNSPSVGKYKWLIVESLTKETELSIALSAQAARQDRRGNVLMASSPPVDEMDMDSTEDDATPCPRKHEEMILAHLTQSKVESEDMEDDEPFKMPSVLVRKGRYQPKTLTKIMMKTLTLTKTLKTMQCG